MQTTASCKIEPLTEKSTVRRFVRRLKQAIAPTHASVRYDGAVKKWAVLDAALKPIRHFEYGLLSNVTFKSEKVQVRLPGCGGGTGIDYAGIAEGGLQEGFLGHDHDGYMNLRFHEGQFLNYNDEPIAKASSVVLLPGRRALYQA